MGSDRPDHPRSGARNGRSAVSLGKRDFRLVMRCAWKARGRRYSTVATAVALRNLMSPDERREPTSIGKMLIGRDPMSPAVFSALLQWTRLPRKDLDCDEFLKSESRIEDALGSSGKDFYDRLQILRQGSVRKLKLSYRSVETQTVVSRLPVELRLRKCHAHDFILRHDNLAGARLIVLEYDHRERTWSSLLDNEGAVIGPEGDRRTVGGATTLQRGGSSLLRFLIGDDDGTCEIFAVVSNDDFPEALTTMLSRDEGGGRELPVDVERLSELFDRWIAMTDKPPLVASVTYSAM